MEKTKRKKSSGKTFRGFFIKLLLVLFVVYTLVSFVKIQIQIREKKAVLDDLNEKITVQQEANAQKSELLENGINREYIARIARQHGYGMPDERVYESNRSLG